MEKGWKHFRYSESERVATVTFGPSDGPNDPAVEVFNEVRALAESLRDRAGEIRVLVFQGEGPGFASGGDVELILERLAEASPTDAYDLAQATGACVRSLRRLPQPAVAAVNGVAAGPGAVLALACDLRLLAERASFHFLFTRIGAAGGDTGICWLLPRVVGLGRASELLMLGPVIDSETALEVGLANRVVPDGELDQAAADLARRLCSSDPAILARTKEMLNLSLEDDEWAGFSARPAEFADYEAGFLGRRRPGG